MALGLPFYFDTFQNIIGVNFQCQMLVRTKVSKVPELWGQQMAVFPVATLCLLHSERAVVLGVGCRLRAEVFMGKEGGVCVTGIPHLSPLGEGDIINSSSW